MNRMQTITVGLLAGLGLGLTSQAHTGADVSANPYERIASRNIFGLVAPTVEPPAPATPDNLPRITINGLMSIFGRYQVLFKASATGQRPPAQDHFYVLSEQQHQDEIQVVRIDTDTGVVTFDNHGTVQDIVLAGWAVTNALLKAPIEKVEPPAAANVPASYPAEFIRAHTPDYLGGADSGLAAASHFSPSYSQVPNTTRRSRNLS